MSSETEPTKNEPAKTGKAKNTLDNKTLTIVGVVVVLLVGSFVLKGIFLTSSNTVLEKAIETASNGDVSVDSNLKDNSITVKDKDGNSTTLTSTQNQDLPDGFPSAIPLYNGQSIKSSYRIDAPEGGTNWSVSAESNDDAATIKNFFVDKLSDWTKSDELLINGSYTLVFTKDNIGLSLNIMPNDSGPASDISYIVTAK